MSRESRPSILIIDNDDGLVTALSTRLGHLGYECVTASTGAQGLAAFSARPFDLVITDLNMPSGDGVALTTTIRRTSDVPIVIVTGFHADYRRDVRAIENICVVEKPFDSARLIELVEAELVLAGCELPEAA